MCITDYGEIISGPGSRDGRIAVWRSHLSQTAMENETNTECTSICEEDEEDDFEVIPKRNIVKFNLDQNQICYLAGGSIN